MQHGRTSVRAFRTKKSLCHHDVKILPCWRHSCFFTSCPDPPRLAKDRGLRVLPFRPSAPAIQINSAFSVRNHTMLRAALSSVQPKIFFGIGGGSDVDTAELLEKYSLTVQEKQFTSCEGANERETTLPSKTASTLVLLALGAGVKADGTFDAEQTKAKQLQRGFTVVDEAFWGAVAGAKSSSGTSRGLGSDLADEGKKKDYKPLLYSVVRNKEVSSETGAENEAPPQNTNNILGLVVDPCCAEESAMIFADLVTWLQKGFSSHTTSPNVHVFAVDTGGDVLAPLFEEKTSADLCLNAKMSASSDEDDLELRAVQNPTRDVVLVRANQLYVPFGRGMGDLSYHQFGPDNSKRDEYSLELLVAAKKLQPFFMSLCVVGPGADGESSVLGVKETREKLFGERRDTYLTVECTTLVPALLSEHPEEHFSKVAKWRVPEEGKTPWIIRKACDRLGGRVEDEQGENFHVEIKAEMREHQIIAYRGRKMRRTAGEEKDSLFKCVMDAAMLREVWFFDDRMIFKLLGKEAMGKAE
ncbi:unnamed protein product [Amoebophrya sp. A120]|nr:unnamed protein product [Amoebophrya sp. A120]|eukprot:GSA120T00024701001.1